MSICDDGNVAFYNTVIEIKQVSQYEEKVEGNNDGENVNMEEITVAVRMRDTSLGDTVYRPESTPFASWLLAPSLLILQPISLPDPMTYDL